MIKTLLMFLSYTVFISVILLVGGAWILGATLIVDAKFIYSDAAKDLWIALSGYPEDVWEIIKTGHWPV
jgi:hypothetical protein